MTVQTRGASDDKKFEQLEEEWRSGVANSSPEDIRRKMADIATVDELARQELKANPEVNQLKDSLNELLEPYKEDSKYAKLRIKYCVKVLQDKGAL